MRVGAMVVTSFAAAAAVAACSKNEPREPARQPGPVAKPSDAEVVTPAPPPTLNKTTPTHQASVSVLAVSAAGGSDAAGGRKVVAYNVPAWQRCYARALASEPGLCGWMTVEVDHHRHGGFAHSFPASRIASAALMRCLSFDLRAPTEALSVPGTTYRFTLVFTPPSKTAAECGPKGGLHATDRRCRTDADCAAIRRLYVSAKNCCHSCNTDAVAKSWVAPAQRACAAIGSKGCPLKKCVALKLVRCHRGQCEVKRPLSAR